MADYIGITEVQSNPFAPLTSELVKQLRDNPLAIAEGAPGAPIVQAGWGPWNGGVYGSGDALIYDHGIDGDVGAIETPLLDPAYQYRMDFYEISRNQTTGTSLFLDLFLEETDAYTISGQNLGAIGASVAVPRVSGYVELQPQDEPRTMHFVEYQARSREPGNESATDLPLNNINFQRANATRITRLRLRSSNTNGLRFGKVYLYRRNWEGK